MSAPRKEIGGRTYAFSTLPATVGIDIELAVVPLLGAVLDDLAKSGIDVDGMMAGDVSKMPAEQKIIVLRIFIAALQQMSARDYTSPDGRPQLGVVSLMKIMFGHVTVIEGDGAKAKGRVIGDSIDLTFTGRPRDKWAVLVFAIWENFKGFLDELPSVSPAGEAAATTGP
jgi:hypothetical protein